MDNGHAYEADDGVYFEIDTSKNMAAKWADLIWSEQEQGEGFQDRGR